MGNILLVQLEIMQKKSKPGFQSNISQSRSDLDDGDDERTESCGANMVPEPFRQRLTEGAAVHLGDGYKQ